MKTNQSKIDQLIQELCPDGVKFKHIWEVTAWDKKFNAVDNHKQEKTYKYTYLLASALRKLAVDGGDIKLLSTGGAEYGWTTEEIANKNISEGEVISIPWGGKATVQYTNGKFVTADNRIATSLDINILDNKFLYYFMLGNLHIIQSFYRGSGIQHPSMAKVLDFKIPVPPLEVQAEIVKILDTFTQLEAELEAELEARRKQYEFYRNQLLTFNDEGGVQTKWFTLGEIIMSLKTGLNPRKNFVLNTPDARNNYVTVRELNGMGITLHEKTDKVNDDALRLIANRSKLEKGDILFSGTGTIGKTALVVKNPTDWNVKEGVYVIKPKKDMVNSKYLLFYLNSIHAKTDYRNRVVGSPVNSVPMSELKKVRIPLPSLFEQERIVSILDKFDKLVNDISEGLPAELNARRKQYEYYRTKLLTFQEAKE